MRAVNTFWDFVQKDSNDVIDNCSIHSPYSLLIRVFHVSVSLIFPPPEINMIIIDGESTECKIQKYSDYEELISFCLQEKQYI